MDLKNEDESETRIQQFVIRLMREINSFVKGRGNLVEACIALDRVAKYLKQEVENGNDQVRL